MTPTAVLSAICAEWNVSKFKLLRHDRNVPLPEARNAAAYIMRDKLGLSPKIIGPALERNMESTVPQMVISAKAQLLADRVYRERVDRLAAEILNGTVVKQKPKKSAVAALEQLVTVAPVQSVPLDPAKAADYEAIRKLRRQKHRAWSVRGLAKRFQMTMPEVERVLGERIFVREDA